MHSSNETRALATPRAGYRQALTAMLLVLGIMLSCTGQWLNLLWSDMQCRSAPVMTGRLIDLASVLNLAIIAWAIYQYRQQQHRPFLPLAVGCCALLSSGLLVLIGASVYALQLPPPANSWLC